MERKDFIKGVGLAGAGMLLPLGKALACTIVPTETSGPYPITAGQLAVTLRTDVRETQVGQLHTIRLKILGNTNCIPIANAEIGRAHV